MLLSKSKRSSEKEMQFVWGNYNLHNDHPKFIVSNQKEESISVYRDIVIVYAL